MKINTLKFIKDRKYNIRIEFYERNGDAIMKFGWTSPGKDLQKEAIRIAGESDAAIVFVGIDKFLEGEGVDKRDMHLPIGQDELIESISRANKKTIVVLINGTPINMQKWVDKVPAIIESWYSGQEGGNAIANILFGDVNPSGKLPLTFPKKLEDNPSYENYPGSAGKVHYAEGIFIGYRYYDTKNVEPLFPFGHGLSYTTFKYSKLKIEPKKSQDGNIKVSMNIKNTGKRKGAEVVQLYIQDEKCSVPRPLKELKRFKKITIKPCKTKKVSFILKPEDLAFYDSNKMKFVVEPGAFKIMIGSSSRDIRLTGGVRH